MLRGHLCLVLPHILRPAKRLHGHLWSFPAQPVLGPPFRAGFGTTVIDRPRVPTAVGGRDAGGMGGFGRVDQNCRGVVV